ncbi:MAG: HAMP domain-containing sensor histidine kinase [Bacteroidota bacterium]
MKKRIQRIVLLALLANLGIIAFQIYWLRNTYKVNEGRFEKDVNEALDDAVTDLVFNGFLISVEIGKINDQISGMQLRHSTVKFDTSASVSLISSDKIDLNNTNTYRDIQVVKQDKVTGDSLQVEMEKIVHNLTNLSKNAIDLKRLDSLYKAELQQRNILLPYNIHYYRSDSLYASTTNKNPFKPIYETNEIRNPGFLNTNSSVKAVFPSQTFFLLKQMSINLLASLFLLIITTASFIYMLRIIFEQKKLSEIKNDFINNMTHELKTPISILSATNEAMTNFNALEDRNRTKQYLGIVKNEIERLSGMVEKVLNISIYEKATFNLKLEATNVEELLSGLASKYKIVQHKDIKIDYENQLIDPVLQLDKVHFTNVLNNLLDNAIKYSQERIQVAIKSFEDTKNVIIQISDNGIGIAKGHQERIFDKFYRVPTGNLHKVKGFGLGLSYVKKIVEKHNGAIEVKSELNQGSVFTIWLPKQA